MKTKTRDGSNRSSSDRRLNRSSNSGVVSSGGGNGRSSNNYYSKSNTRNGFTLYECLEEHTKEEVLDSGNEVYCSSCKQHKAATKIVRFSRCYLPEILILSLKRFEFREVSNVLGMHASHREKIDTFVDFPIDALDLSDYCDDDGSDSSGSGKNSNDDVIGDDSGKVSNNSSNINDINDDRDFSSGSASSSLSTIYDLFAVCNHYGRMGFGHYTAAARDWDRRPSTSSPSTSSSISTTSATNECTTAVDTKWYSYDDNAVTGPCNDKDIEEEVHSKNAYILFYKRRPLSV